MSQQLLPEWAPQRLIQLCWPSQPQYWGNHIQAAQHTHSQIIAHISQYQGVLLLHSPSIASNLLRQQLESAGAKLSNVNLVAQDNNDIWCRDYGPISVSGPTGNQLLDFTFTGWGGKFPADLDNAATSALVAKGLYTNVSAFPLILEGGAIDYDGNGTLITTKACLLNPNRNPEWSMQDYQNFFAEQLGIQQVIWLENGYLKGDDTDSHVDMLARFAANNRLIFQGCERPEDEHFAPLQALKAELSQCRNQQGQPYHLVELPFPDARIDEDGERLPASYANFLITNQQVLVPIYGCEADAKALSQIAQCFSDREIIGINCEALIQQYGSLHCATMQVAA